VQAEAADLVLVGTATKHANLAILIGATACRPLEEVVHGAGQEVKGGLGETTVRLLSSSVIVAVMLSVIGLRRISTTAPKKRSGH